ncbi:MAG: hypothetical protein JJLCMIEE_02822 [Acidimicrobiales bacterium]|nr:MAG: hypothetical protein EDR02_13710 [Actinomycetota bacterium]MBV6509724.1 hypothetical protein [Acidimicrobiales bacterium]RIK04881.1 MAG: hypothetical protein DCC48_12650 [Acidobacteriota bacterium]
MTTSTEQGWLKAAVAAALVVSLLGLGSPAGAGPVGPQFQVSQVGPPGSPSAIILPWFRESAVAYTDAATDRYLVVWAAQDNFPGGDSTYEVWGRLYTGSGSPVTNEFRISEMGAPNDDDYLVSSPAVAYNSQAKEFLVVWAANDDQPGMALGELEIFGQRVSPAGAQPGVQDFRISKQGAGGDPSQDALFPSVAYNSDLNEYLVVWQGDRVLLRSGAPEEEIYAQRLSATGGEKAPEARISTTGPYGDTAYQAVMPDVVHNPVVDEYFVVWSATDGGATYGTEIFSQRLGAGPANAGTEIGTDKRVTYVTPDPTTENSAVTPAVSFDPTELRYLVVWGDSRVVNGAEDSEVWAQALHANSNWWAGKAAGPPTQLSQTGPGGIATVPDVVYNAAAKQHLVVFAAQEKGEQPAVYGQATNSSGEPTGADDFAISTMPFAIYPSVAYGSKPNQYLAIWTGAFDEETYFEIWARKVAP